MPRDGSNVFSAPPGTTATSGTTIESAKYNALVADLVADANLARPVVAGGTGASTAAAALVNLGLTATAAEINILDGATVTTAELNVLDGIPATLTATELGYLDGVTSSIQTQLNAKQATITTLPLANGGTGAALVDPNADRILFWDDSAGAVTFLEAGSGLSITGTTLSATATAIDTTVYGVLASDYTLSNTGSSQKLFNWSTNGAVTLPTGVYQFECIVGIDQMAGVTGNGDFSLRGAGTATLARILYVLDGADSALNAAGVNLSGLLSTSSGTSGQIAVTSTATEVFFRVSGVFDVTTSGTLIPSFALNNSAVGARVKAGSSFMCLRIGATGTATAGTWS